MESPEALPDTPLETPVGDVDEVVYPCKGCGEILEEGKAFELAGNRWHIDCFRCNTCGTLLDSDANLLLLGDGSLICNNCTYSCSACGNKIEDLAILTGEQAFCASCFKCRNCKRQIENLRYARTSQGIFCMACHESLMARRRKKSKASRQHTAALNGAAANVFDKSLPALPPNAALLPAELETPPSDGQVDTPSDMSPATGPKPRLRSKKEASTLNLKREASPSDVVRRDNSVHSSTYDRRHSSHLNVDQDSSNADDGLFVPLALDNTPALPPMSQTRRRKGTEGGNEATTTAEETKAARDYFSRVPHSGSHREAMKEIGPASSPRSHSVEREAQRSTSGNGKPTSSPHIAFQEKGWQPSSEKVETLKRRKEHSTAASDSPDTTNEKRERPRPHLNPQSYPLRSSTNSDIFKLQDVPKSKKAESRRSSRSDATRSPTSTSPVDNDESKKSSRTEATMGGPLPTDGALPSGDAQFEDIKSRQVTPEVTKYAQVERPARGDSLAAMRSQPQSSMAKALAESQGPSSYRGHDRKASTSSIPAVYELPANSPKVNGGVVISKPVESPISKSVLDPPVPPSRSASRRSPTSALPANDSFVSPRAPPPAPSSDSRHKANGSIGSVQTEYTEGLPSATQATIPEHTATGDLSMEEEMARIIQNEDGTVNGSMMRRVSNAVKHGRSFSDRGSQKWRSPGTNEWNSPKAGNMEISSPSFPGADGKEDISQLKNQLRRAQSRIAELETEKNALLEKSYGAADIQQVNTELRQKRSTMAFLDTQREMVVRELEIMTDHLSKAKDSGKPLDLTQLQSSILSEFAHSLQKLKDTLGTQIEDLIHRRNELTDEISSLIQMKDKGFQEYESLSTKNQQLNELNGQLVHNIQDLYKANRQPGNSFDGGRPSANGLGIYNSQKDSRSESITTTSTLLDQRSASTPVVETPLGATMVGPDDVESGTVLTAPQVVNIRKGQPKKFNWKKGGQGVAKNITKGLKGAFASGDRFPSGQVPRDAAYNLEGVPYGQMPRNDSADSSSTIRERERDGSQPKITLDPGSRDRQTPGFGGFFVSAQKERERANALKPAGNVVTKQASNGSNSIAAEPPSARKNPVLFGSDLTSRCQYEHLVVPSIVSHCITEVETRGMNQEGIYRKSGGSNQVKTIQIGFEKDGDFDITDPDLDIHAVTSALKQYFRKLPLPLITHEVYDLLMEAVRSIEDGGMRASTVRSALATLPRAHYDVLEVLISHLARVMEQERENLMTPHNLAVVFAPTIMRPPSLEQEMKDMIDQRKAVTTILENLHLIFPASGNETGSQVSRSASALSGADSGSGLELTDEHGPQQAQQSLEKQMHQHQSAKDFQETRRLPIPR
ncbi:MAG: Rho-type gtpase-activating protein [Bathelium mastoideum]|nr:MAG: Rho-type gtpase-activating protein [Bathelium mastoideum]